MRADPPARAALRAARAAHGWSQSEAARELAALGTARGGPIASAASLKTLLSRWENGHAVPDPQHRTLLAELYGRSATELGLHEPPESQRPGGAGRLRAGLAAAAAIGDELLAVWHEQLAVVRRLDDEVGAAGSAELVRAQAAELDHLLAHTTEPGRRGAVAAILAEVAALGGWQALDLGDPEEAWHRHDRARSAAQEAGAPGTTAQALAGQAAVLVEIGEARLGVALLARARPGHSALARAWHAAGYGAALAAAGAARESGRAFDAAERALRSASPPPDPVRPAPAQPTPAPPVDLVGVPGGLTIELTDLPRWRGHALAALGDPGAVGPLEHALATGPRSVRDRAVLHAELAVALAATDRAADAAEHARVARHLAERIGSARTVAVLQRAPPVPRPEGAR